MTGWFRGAARVAPLVLLLVMGSAAAAGGGLTVRQVLARIAAAPALRPPIFVGADLSRLNLAGVAFHGADLKDANLLETVLTGADLDGCRLDGANLAAARLDGARARHASLRGATLLMTAARADFTGADLRDASGYLIARHVILTGAQAQGAQLGPDMSNQPMGLLHTILAGCRCQRTDFSGADLSFADLEGADFTSANLRDTQLRGANLSRAILRRADLTGADVTDADVAGAIFSGARGRRTMHGWNLTRNTAQAIWR